MDQTTIIMMKTAIQPYPATGNEGGWLFSLIKTTVTIRGMGHGGRGDGWMDTGSGTSAFRW